jgi:hypothetical protein
MRSTRTISSPNSRRSQIGTEDAQDPVDDQRLERRVPRQRGAQSCPGEGVSREAGGGAPHTTVARPRAARAGRQDASARAHRKDARPWHALPRAFLARGEHGVWRRIAFREHDRRDRNRLGAGSHRSRRRSDDQGRRLVSALGEEDRPRARHRDGEPAAGYPSLRFRRRLPAIAVGGVSGPLHGRPHLPRPVDPFQDGRQATRAGVRPLHGRRRLYSGAVRLQRDRARLRGRVPRRPAPRAGGDRRGRHGRGSRRRRHAHQRLGRLRLSRGERGRGDPHRTGNRRAMGTPAQMGMPARARGGARLRSARNLRNTAQRRQEAIRHARDPRPRRRRQSLSRVPAQLRPDPGVRLCQYLGFQRSACSPTTACCSTIPR